MLSLSHKVTSKRNQDQSRHEIRTDSHASNKTKLLPNTIGQIPIIQRKWCQILNKPKLHVAYTRPLTMSQKLLCICALWVAKPTNQMTYYKIKSNLLTATSLEWPGFLVPIIRWSIHFTLIETSLPWPPLYNGQFILPQGGHCREF